MLKIKSRTPTILCLDFERELTDKFTWYYAYIDLSDYILCFSSDYGSYTIQFNKSQNDDFIDLLSNLTIREFIYKISDFETFNFDLSVMDTCSKIKRLYGEEGIRAIETIKQLDRTDETTFHSNCVKICRCNAIYDAFNIIQIRKGYSSSELIVAEFFRDVVQPYLKENKFEI